MNSDAQSGHTAGTVRDRCRLCGQGRFADATEVAQVHSNVRRWKDHFSTVWRCPVCGSLHSLETVDLGPFYAAYPFGQRRLDPFTRRVFSRYLGHLRKAGVTANSTVLDYGCGSGLLLDYLAETGIRSVSGYDAYVPQFDDPTVLERKYDCVIAQDVIEHVEDPEALLSDLAGCVKPGGLLCIGTPRAEGIDLRQTERFIHSLHQPYHLHILSESVLITIANRHGLSLESVLRRHTLDTPYPFVNWTFLKGYLKRLDNTLDAGFEPPRIAKIATSPYLLFTGLVGYLFPSRTEMLVLLRKASD